MILGQTNICNNHLIMNEGIRQRLYKYFNNYLCLCHSHPHTNINCWYKRSACVGATIRVMKCCNKLRVVD